jgi:hypothetical protein
MTTEEQIRKILAARSLASAVGKRTVKEVLMEIHPDRCSHPEATAAMAALNALRSDAENGVKLDDDAGAFRAWADRAEFPAGAAQNASQKNWDILSGTRDPLTDVLARYIGRSETRDDTGRKVSFRARAVQLAGLKLPQAHVNWILSRMLEFAAYVNKRGFVHGSLHPNSVFITPEDHGIQVSSMYTMTRIGQKLTGASGKYLHWYPAENRKTKIATPDIDVEMCMRTAAVLLGDPSGTGVTLRKDPSVNKAFLEFIMARHSDPGKAWLEYRELLGREFKKEFVILDL